MSDSFRWNINSVAILSTGSEILQGQYADTNARYLAEWLTLHGLPVVQIAAAPDDEATIHRTITHLAQHADLIICTGGLGPTADDVNRFVFARLYQRQLLRDDMAIDAMAKRFVSRGLGPLPESNEVQAMIPEGAVVFYNKWGTAPGFLIRPDETGNGLTCGLLALPGPPSEMIPMFEKLAWPEILRTLAFRKVGVVRTIHTFGCAESEMGAMVKELFAPQKNVEFTILAKRHGVDLRIKAFGDSDEAARAIINDYESAVRRLVAPHWIYGVDEETLPIAVGGLLKAAGHWATTAESCTGGLVAEMLTEVAGSSAYVGECHVTYSNKAKTRVLGVQESTLEQFGAVSEQTAREMADGARRVSGADWAISITGIAGPDGGSDEKPVGFTWIGLAGPTGTDAVVHRFLGDRSQIRLRAAQNALNMLRLKLLEHTR